MAGEDRAAAPELSAGTSRTSVASFRPTTELSDGVTELRSARRGSARFSCSAWSEQSTRPVRTPLAARQLLARSNNELRRAQRYAMPRLKRGAGARLRGDQPGVSRRLGILRPTGSFSAGLRETVQSRSRLASDSIRQLAR